MPAYPYQNTNDILGPKTQLNGTEMANGNGASTEDIQKVVAEKFNKEMKVEVTFVDKEPAAVMDGPPSTSQEGYTV